MDDEHENKLAIEDQVNDAVVALQKQNLQLIKRMLILEEKVNGHVDPHMEYCPHTER